MLEAHVSVCRERREFLNSSYAGHVTFSLAYPARDDFFMGWRVPLQSLDMLRLQATSLPQGNPAAPGSQAARRLLLSLQIPAAGREGKSCDPRSHPRHLLVPVCVSVWDSLGGLHGSDGRAGWRRNCKTPMRNLPSCEVSLQ